MLNPTQRRVTGKGSITTASVDNSTQKLGAKGAFAVPDPIPYTLSWTNSIRAPLPNPHCHINHACGSHRGNLLTFIQ